MKKLLTTTLLAASASAAHATTTIDFDELDPGNRPDYFDDITGFTSQGVSFSAASFSGFSYSNDNDTTTPGFGNQYAAYTGTDFSGTGNYAINFYSPFTPTSVIDLPAGQTAQSVYVTNTTYAALSMLNGDSFAKAFGGQTGDDPDYFDVIFTGFAGGNATGGETGTVTFRLADYTFADNSLDYIVDTWELVDLTALGNAASIQVSFASTDVGGFGINTPQYVALDNLVIVPEPAGLGLLALGGLVLLRRRA